jgi:uncharacterized membrane protein YkvA (DUF1232 family)
MTNRWQIRVKQVKSEVLTLYLAYRDPRTPWYARIFTAIVVGYALSPIDLIPDFIPILGFLDDLVLVPAGLLLALKMIPESIMESSREKANALVDTEKPVSRTAAAVIICIWLLSAILLITCGYRLFCSLREGT